MADIPEEHLTEELLDRLLASASIEQYLDEGLVSARTLTDYLFDRMEAHDLRRADVVRASGLNATVVYDIFSGKSRPGRDHAIMLAFGLKCTLRETQRLLRLAGVSELWCKQRRDAIIIWCIRNGFDRIATDDELYRMGEATFVPGRLTTLGPTTLTSETQNRASRRDMDDKQAMHAMSIDDAYHVERTLARGPSGVTELVSIERQRPVRTQEDSLSPSATQCVGGAQRLPE